MSASKAKGIFACEMMQQAEKQPEFKLLTFEDHHGSVCVLTYAELVEKGTRLANALRKNGFNTGDVFACIMENSPATMIALYAASATRTVLVTIDPKTSWDRMAYDIRQSGAKGVIVEFDFLESLIRIQEILEDVKTIAVSLTGKAQASDIMDLPSLEEIFMAEPGFKLPLRGFKKSDPWLAVNTSGSTGIPKMICLPAQVYHDYGDLARSVWKYRKTDRLYTALPLVQINNLMTILFPALSNALPVIVNQSFSSNRIWHICQKYGCTVFYALGHMLAEIYAKPVHLQEKRNPVRLVISSGMPGRIWQGFEQRFNVKIHECYFNAEGGFAHNPPENKMIGTFGKPLAETLSFKIINQKGKECHADEIGELIFQPKNGKTNPKLLTGGMLTGLNPRKNWLKSDDLVFRSHEGNFYFHSKKTKTLTFKNRSDDILKIESVINNHPHVDEVCVYHGKISNDSSGDMFKTIAAVVPKDFLNFDIGAIFERCRDNLEKEQIPTQLQLVKYIPKTLTGKKAFRSLGDDLEDGGDNVFYSEDYL